ASAFLPGVVPATGIEVTSPDPGWPLVYDDLACRIRGALGWRALQLDHVGSGPAGQAHHRHRPDRGRSRPGTGLRAGARGDRVPAGDPRALVVRPSGDAG